MLKRLGGFLILIVFILGAAAATSWYMALPHTAKTTQISRGKAIEAVYATAVIEPVTWGAIAPIRTGRIAEINVREGDQVKKGDVLARLDDEDLKAQMVEEIALNNYYKAQVKRSTSLVKKGVTPQEEHERRQTELARSNARIDMIAEQIKQLSLLAPMDGIVLWRDVDLGEVKEAGQPLFWVGEPLPLRLEAEVDEEDIPKIRENQRVLITADAFPNEALDGTVNRISPKGDPINKSYRVYMNLPEDTKLMIGMTVETNTIVQEKDNVLLAPSEAIIDSSAVWQFTKKGEHFIAHKTPIKIGIRGEAQTEIIDGLKEGDKIILPPFTALTEGTKVRAE